MISAKNAPAPMQVGKISTATHIMARPRSRTCPSRWNTGRISTTGVATVQASRRLRSWYRSANLPASGQMTAMQPLLMQAMPMALPGGYCNAVVR